MKTKKTKCKVCSNTFERNNVKRHRQLPKGIRGKNCVTCSGWIPTANQKSERAYKEVKKDLNKIRKRAILLELEK